MALSPEARILLYVPNVIGYVRLACLLGSWWCWPEQPGCLVVLYVLQAVLDGVDGCVARRLHQCSTFGAWLDVVLDNLGRTMLWSLLFDWGWMVGCLEWLCFVCNSGASSQWKAAIIANGPPLCRWVMADGFKTRWGVLAISGLHVLPIWLMGVRRGLFSPAGGPLGWLPAPLFWAVLIILVAGRLICALVELWCILAHVRAMLREDAAAASK